MMMYGVLQPLGPYRTWILSQPPHVMSMVLFWCLRLDLREFSLCPYIRCIAVDVACTVGTRYAVHSHGPGLSCKTKGFSPDEIAAACRL